jgi:hypothetical protein
VITVDGLEQNFDIPNLDGYREFPNLVEAAVIFNPPRSDLPGARQDVIHELIDDADIEGRRALTILSWYRAARKLVSKAGLTVEQPQAPAVVYTVA